MSDNKVRSKSIGRISSRSFKSLYSFKSIVLKHVGKEYLNVDSHKGIYQGKYPEILILLCCIHKLRQEIDAHMSK